MRLLVEDCKAEVEAKDSYGTAALHWAAVSGHEAVVRLLLDDYKADIEVKTDKWYDGATPGGRRRARGSGTGIKVGRANSTMLQTFPPTTLNVCGPCICVSVGSIRSDRIGKKSACELRHSLYSSGPRDLTHRPPPPLWRVSWLSSASPTLGQLPRRFSNNSLPPFPFPPPPPKDTTRPVRKIPQHDRPL